MSKKEIQEANSMIALFMGARLDYWEARDRVEACNKEEDENGDTIWVDSDGFQVFDASYWNFIEVKKKYLPPIDYWNIPEDELKYHCSWDWLMPVVQKINERDDYEIIISGIIKVYCTKYNQSQIQSIESFTIEGVFQVVVETIKRINNE